jgi:Lrp/AsnC family transcriptional regulator, leucine-responsive regulatory protein
MGSGSDSRQCAAIEAKCAFGLLRLRTILRNNRAHNDVIAAMTARLDAIDRKILEIVQADGRVSNVDLAGRIHLSAPQCFRRVRSLEERGVIRGYRAEVAPEAIGFGVTAYVSVSIGGDDFGRVREIEAEIRAFPEILECYSVSGEDDYLLKVVAHDLKSLSTFLTDRLMQVPGIDDVRSMIALEEIKPTSPLPVD